MSLRGAARAARFRYDGLRVEGPRLIAHYDLDGRPFTETVLFEGLDELNGPARAVAELWYLVAGLSYYKAGAARIVDLAATPLGVAGERLVRASLREGLAEYAYRQDLDLDDVALTGGAVVAPSTTALSATQVLVPFGGGIDSVVTTSALNEHLDQTLFVVRPSSGGFAPLDATAARTGRPVLYASRTIDPTILERREGDRQGHVPISAMITLLAAVAALATGRGGVAMSCERSASEANLTWRGRPVNHQWSKSFEAETLLAEAIAERVGDDLVVASTLRDRSEIWVAQIFSDLPQYHDVFRSCNRAFRQRPATRAPQWCGECDKCLFTNLMLAPFLARTRLVEIFGSDPLADDAREAQLRVLVGLGSSAKPFECVGDPDESAAALQKVATLPEWSDVEHLSDLARHVHPSQSFAELLVPHGPSRVPPDWLR